MTTEDLQERYRDKTRELKPQNVPLAADAAHLLTEYLDNVSVEFVKQGVAEPYRITREYEEIFVQELQKLGSSNKLTYEVASKMLESYGTPKQLVTNYIRDNDISTHTILSESAEKVTNTYITSLTSRFDKLVQFVVFFVLVGTIAAEIGLLSFLIFSRVILYELSIGLPFILFPFVVLELLTGMTSSTAIKQDYYHKLRESVRFLLSTIVLLTVWYWVDMRRYNDGTYIVSIITWLFIYGIGFIKDHSDLLYSSAPREKPVARFILPSYILFGTAYILGIFVLLLDDNRIGYSDIFDSETVFILVAMYLVAAIGLLMDYNRKYPFSWKKLGYQFIFFIFPVYLFSYPVRIVSEWWSRDLLFYYPQFIFLFAGIWALTLAIIIPLLFRWEIKTQLEAYKASLENYRNS